MISLAGKAALITGGSRGIGAAAVKLFAQAGADVVFNYNKAKDAAALVEAEARKHGTRVEAFKADVSKHADNKKLVEQTMARLGRIDILVANAGVWNVEDLPIEKMTEKQWDDMLRINAEERLFGDSFCLRAYDQAKVRKDYSDHLHGRATRRIVPHALRRIQGRDHQPYERSGNGTSAARNSGELGGPRLGGYRHVQPGAGHQSRAEDGRSGDSAGPRRLPRKRLPAQFCFWHRTWPTS